MQRWWDGAKWTAQYRKIPARAGLLPSWLSWPIVVLAPFFLLMQLGNLVWSPVAMTIGLLVGAVLAVPLVGAFVWLDRLEPEPWGERVHALLWGAVVAISVAGVINGAAAFLFGDTVAAVVSAPVFEELLKGAGVMLVLWRGRVDSIMDGVVYAGWIGAGFALVENLSYTVMVSAEEGLAWGLATALVRGVPMMFAHSLFSLPMGFAAGLAVTRGWNPYVAVAVGWFPAAVLHALWNAGFSLFAPPLGTLFMFSVFAVSAVLVTVSRLSGRAVLFRQIPVVAFRYGLTAQEASAFSSWAAAVRVRRTLASPQKRAFDRMHAAVARLAAVQEHKVPPSDARMRELVEGLWEARAAMPARW